jgi:hypothetical protein
LAKDAVDKIEELISRVEEAGEISRVEAALERRRRELGLAGGHAAFSEVVEYRPHEDGILQAEVRRQRNKDGTEREFGPYWYFKVQEGGRRRSIYLGKTDDPGTALAAKREEASS